MLLALSDRVYTLRRSWAEVGTGELGNYAYIFTNSANYPTTC